MGRGTRIAAVALLAAGAAAAFLLLRDDGASSPPAGAPDAAPRVPAGSRAAGESHRSANAPAPPAAPRTGDGIVTGVLLRSRTNLPLEGTATATDGAGCTTTVRSRPDGSFRLAGLARGEPLRIECSAPGLLPRVLPRVVVPAGQDVDLSYVYLGEGVRLGVLVVERTGAPVPGCVVSVVDPNLDPDRDPWGRPGPPQASETTDAGGSVVFAALPPGTWKVVAAEPGHADAAVSVFLAEGALRDPLRILLAPGFALEGRVLAADGRPAPGVAVSLSNTAAALSDAAGIFRVAGLLPGSFTLYVRVHAGDWEGMRTVEIPAPGPVEVRLAPRAELRGRVVEDPGGAGIGEAEVQVSLDEGRSPGFSPSAGCGTRTGPDGAFRFPDLPALPIIYMVATKSGFLPSTEIRQSQRIVPQPLPAGSVKEVEIRLQRGTVVRGVAREAGGKPVAGAWVQLTVWRGREGEWNPPEVHTDGEGRFVFAAVFPGRALLEAGARNRHLAGVPQGTYGALRSGDLPESCGLVVPDHGEVVKDLLLVPDARVEGRILFRDGKPAPGYLPEVKDGDVMGGGVPGTPSAEDGSFVVEDLGAGTGMVVAAVGPWGTAGTSDPFDIGESAVVKGVTVTVASPASLAGRVVREDGKPAGGATLRLTPAPADPNRPFDVDQAAGLAVAVPVAVDGTFRVEALAPGRWIPDAAAPGCLPRRGDPVEVGDGEMKEGVDLVLAPEQFVAGRVLLFDGTPAAGARVWARRTANPMGGEPAVDQGGSEEVLANAEGGFRVGGLERGAYEVRATREDSVATRATAESGATELVLRLGQGFAIDGRVVAAGTGKPLEGIDVLVSSACLDAAEAPPEGSAAAAEDGMGRAGGRSASEMHAVQTAVGGSFRIQGLASGTYDLQCSDADSAFVPKTVSGLRAGGAPVVVEMARGLSITGRVQDAAGIPLAPGQLGLAVQSGSRPGFTSYFEVAEDGTFAVKGIAAGTYWLTVESANYGNSPDTYVPRTVEAEAGRNDLVIPLVRGKAISGRVRMADGSEPGQRSLRLTLHAVRGDDLPDTQDPCPMGQDGTFTTAPLPEGIPFDIEVTSWDEPVEAAAARDLLPGSSGVTIQMQAGGTIRGRVLDPDGKPVAGALAWAVSSRTRGESPRVQADAEGNFVLPGLAPGSYRLYASSAEANLAPQQPEGAVPAGTTDAVVRTAKGLEFRARFIAADGGPVAGTGVQVEWWTRGKWEVMGSWPLVDGLLDIRALFPARIRVRVPRPGESGDTDDPLVLAGPFEVPCPEQVITVGR